jgi:hypothetical protein
MKPIPRSCMRTRVALLVGAVCFIGHLENTTAAPCDGVPFCETQQQAPVHYWSWQTSGWAYYCSGDHPYYWNNGQNTLGFGNNFTVGQQLFFKSPKIPLLRANLQDGCNDHQLVYSSGRRRHHTYARLLEAAASWPLVPQQ